MVNHANKQGELSLDTLAEKYRDFYQNLTSQYGFAEKKNNPLNLTEKLNNNSYIKKSIRENPFEKFERKRFFYQCKDLNFISFDPVLWEKLKVIDIEKICKQLIEDGRNYFLKLNINLKNEDLNHLLAVPNLRPQIQGGGVSTIIEEIGTQLPYYKDLKIACGHFQSSRHDEVESYLVPDGYGNLHPDKNFIANASGNSMNGGKHAIQDGDLLLLEWISSSSAGSISEKTLAIEVIDEAGDSQYLLRKVKKQINGQYLLKANNPEYKDKLANENMRTFARLKGVIDPLSS